MAKILGISLESAIVVCQKNDDGTTPEHMAAAAGDRLDFAGQATLNELANFLSCEAAIILWNKTDENGRDGHYSEVLEVKDDKTTILDPDDGVVTFRTEDLDSLRFDSYKERDYWLWCMLVRR